MSRSACAVWHQYFDTDGGALEYPEPTLQPIVALDERFLPEERVPASRLYLYISHTHLDGWVNYVEIDRARLVPRYRSPTECAAKLAAWVANAPFHTKLLDLEDDVHLLARDKAGAWWWFHYDQDVSDCDLGRIWTHDEDDVVRAKFDAMCDERAGFTSVALVIPVESIRGWVSG